MRQALSSATRQQSHAVATDVRCSVHIRYSGHATTPRSFCYRSAGFRRLFGGSLHSTPLRVTAGPSLSGFGTSPAQFGDPSRSHAFENSSTITVPTSATPVLGQELSAIDLKGLDPLINRADPLLPSNVEAVSSQSGSGTSKGTPDRPGIPADIRRVTRNLAIGSPATSASDAATARPLASYGTRNGDAGCGPAGLRAHRHSFRS